MTIAFGSVMPLMISRTNWPGRMPPSAFGNTERICTVPVRRSTFCDDMMILPVLRIGRAVAVLQRHRDVVVAERLVEVVVQGAKLAQLGVGDREVDVGRIELGDGRQHGLLRLRDRAFRRRQQRGRTGDRRLHHREFEIEPRVLDVGFDRLDRGARLVAGGARVVELLRRRDLLVREFLNAVEVFFRLERRRLRLRKLRGGAVVHGLIGTRIDAEQRVALLDARAFGIFALHDGAGHHRADFDGAKAGDAAGIGEGQRHVGALDLDHADVGRRRGAGLLRRRRGAAIAEKIIAAGGREEDDQGAGDDACCSCHSKCLKKRRRVASSPQAPATASLCIALTWGCGGRKPSLWAILTQSCQSDGVGWAIALARGCTGTGVVPRGHSSQNATAPPIAPPACAKVAKAFLVAVPQELKQLQQNPAADRPVDWRSAHRSRGSAIVNRLARLQHRDRPRSRPRRIPMRRATRWSRGCPSRRSRARRRRRTADRGGRSGSGPSTFSMSSPNTHR